MSSNSPTPKATLTVTAGQSKGGELLLDSRIRYTLGRGHENHLQVRDLGVSREHCSVECDGQYFWLVDNGSANGTFVNDERVGRYMLYDGDVIRLGRSEIVFRRKPE